MAEAIVVAVSGLFLAPMIKALIDWALSELGERYQFLKDLEENQEKLDRALQAMRSNVEDMKKYSIRDDSNDWCTLWELLDATQDAAEEFMDMFQYEVVELKRKKRRFKGSKKKLKQLLDRSEDAKMTSEDLLRRLRENQHGDTRPRNPMKPDKTSNKLFGYEQELDNLVSQLTTASEEARTRVVGIIGHGGIGKTELARWAFHDPKTEEKFGENRIWVGVSGVVKPEDLLKEIYKYMFKKDPPAAGLEKEITNKIKESRQPYLLVFDEVWNDETSEEQQRQMAWKTVLAPFKQLEDANNKGSRILLTSRAQICLDTLGRCIDPSPQRQIKIVLNGINDTAQLKLLLMEEARKQTGATTVPRELEEHLKKHVGKLHGSPSAAQKFVILSRENLVKKTSGDSRRRSGLNNIIEEGLIEDVLVKDYLSSFEVLPLHLQRCLAFCSIFPKGWRFDVKKLTRMWTALGFVEAPQREGGRTVDHVAKEYFDALVERSLFQEVVGTPCYEIHKHIHCMIRTVSPDHYCRVDKRSSGTVPPTTVRHLSVTTKHLGQLQEAVGLSRLRTLLVFDMDDEDGADSETSSSASSRTSTDEILNKLIPRKKKDLKKKLKGVRVLDLSSTRQITAVPSGIGKLEHLRYLGLPSTIGCLSNDVTKLLPLQTLSVIFSSDDICLPRDMSRLTNLRHLDMGKEEYIAQIADIGSMRMLQDSVEFHAHRTEQGHHMRELQGLNSLRRKLTIKGLDKVEGSTEAGSACLGAKVHLKTLELEWGQRSDSAARGSAQSDLEVLEGLRPHPNLEDLKIQNYVGINSPSWLVSVEKLRCLQLINCPKLHTLSLGAFPSLRTMVLTDMAELEAWEGTDDGSSDGSDSAPALFPNLQKVEIVRCPKLVSVVGLQRCGGELMHLHIEGCPLVEGEFERSKFHPDLQLNDDTPDWPDELSFKDIEPPPPQRADGQMPGSPGQPPTPPRQGERQGEPRPDGLRPPRANVPRTISAAVTKWYNFIKRKTKWHNSKG